MGTGQSAALGSSPSAWPCTGHPAPPGHHPSSWGQCCWPHPQAFSMRAYRWCPQCLYQGPRGSPPVGRKHWTAGLRCQELPPPPQGPQALPMPCPSPTPRSGRCVTGTLGAPGCPAQAEGGANPSCRQTAVAMTAVYSVFRSSRLWPQRAPGRGPQATILSGRVQGHGRPQPGRRGARRASVVKGVYVGVRLPPEHRCSSKASPPHPPPQRLWLPNQEKKGRGRRRGAAWRRRTARGDRQALMVASSLAVSSSSCSRGLKTTELTTSSCRSLARQML